MSSMLAAHDNYHVDIAARLGELGRQPYTARAFFVRWADRIVFGTDVPGDPATNRIYYRFLETLDESFPYDDERSAGPGPLADPRPRACPTTCSARCMPTTRDACWDCHPAASR